MRVELVGEELRVYRRSEESRRREEEEVAYRRKRQDELAMVYLTYAIIIHPARAICLIHMTQTSYTYVYIY